METVTELEKFLVHTYMHFFILYEPFNYVLFKNCNRKIWTYNYMAIKSAKNKWHPVGYSAPNNEIPINANLKNNQANYLRSKYTFSLSYMYIHAYHVLVYKINIQLYVLIYQSSKAFFFIEFDKKFRSFATSHAHTFSSH